MNRIGVTGHLVLPATVLPSVRAGMLDLLRVGDVEMLSSLAAGADQLCASLALDSGATVTAVIPGTGYEAHFTDDMARTAYHRLLARCTERIDLPAEPTPEEAYDAAGRWIVDHCDLLVAVWDGRPSRGRGGTGDVVRHARRTGVEVTVLWRPGVLRP
ncbi:hypothetical protein OG824_01040 [Streptomyces prunicolor]|uniref:hypothetical protein n=1 Tax=Streptomyces prunicolor TaxID=67348 RepID=UPI00225C2609|nr:hypothetical protein [Streptomyces prunicolor]MCX5233822.1 hypothetical protein [Streptomyces prunicolor]